MHTWSAPYDTNVCIIKRCNCTINGIITYQNVNSGHFNEHSRTEKQKDGWTDTRKQIFSGTLNVC